ncbi:MAG: hypothetical protein ACPHFO_07710 [Acidimicrobiales bacterium]
MPCRSGSLRVAERGDDKRGDDRCDRSSDVEEVPPDLTGHEDGQQHEAERPPGERVGALQGSKGKEWHRQQECADDGEVDGLVDPVAERAEQAAEGHAEFLDFLHPGVGVKPQPEVPGPGCGGHRRHPAEQPWDAPVPPQLMATHTSQVEQHHLPSKNGSAEPQQGGVHPPVEHGDGAPKGARKRKDPSARDVEFEHDAWVERETES